MSTSTDPTLSKAKWQLGDAIADGKYMFTHYTNPRKAVCVFGNWTSDGAPIHQWDYVPTTSQQWDITKVDTTHYKIISVNSGKALEVPVGAGSGTQLEQNPYTGSDRQLWEITHLGYGVNRITNKATGYAVTLDQPSDANGIKITQEPITGDGSQYFFFANIDENFFNPLMSSGADPWVIEKDGFYYYLHTTGANITIRKTARMSDLGTAPATVVWTPPSGQPYSHNLWAPELHFLDGNWYVYFAADDGNDANHRMYVIENTSADPTTGSWTFKGKISDTSDIWAIDGTVLETGGKRYFIWSGWRYQNTSQSGIQQLYIAEMSNPWTITGSRHMISEPTYSWEKHGLVNEGPTALKNSTGHVFIVYSASGCWTDEYKLGWLLLDKDTDPLVKANWSKLSGPVFQKSTANSVYGPGHASFFKSADGTEDWILYHANSESGQGCGGGRSPRMQEFNWTGYNTPDFGVPLEASTAVTVVPNPSGE